MITLSFEAFRHLFGFSSPRLVVDVNTAGDTASTSHQEETCTSNGDTAPPLPPGKSVGPAAEAGSRGSAWTGSAPLLSAYFGARAEETLAMLLEGLAREMARELRQPEDEIKRTIAAEIAEVREGVATSQRELPRIGREIVRSGAALESIREGISSIVPAVERLEVSLRDHLARDLATVEEELAGPDEILATLDGLEIGLREGREMVGALIAVQNRLKDTTTQRWWRAMGEATGVKRPLPEIPLADVESLVTGLELTYRRLRDALSRRGVVGIEAVGRPFDPHVHEAVAVEPCLEDQDGLVLREQRAGYRATDRVVRLSQVVVGRAELNKAGASRCPEPNSRGRSRSRREHVEPDGAAGSQDAQKTPEEGEAHGE